MMLMSPIQKKCQKNTIGKYNKNVFNFSQTVSFRQNIIFLVYIYYITIFRIAKLKGITSGPPSECGEDAEDVKKSKRSSKNCESNEDEKYIDYKGNKK